MNAAFLWQFVFLNIETAAFVADLCTWVRNVTTVLAFDAYQPKNFGVETPKEW
jgi:hypothetical protein